MASLLKPTGNLLASNKLQVSAFNSPSVDTTHPLVAGMIFCCLPQMGVAANICQFGAVYAPNASAAAFFYNSYAGPPKNTMTQEGPGVDISAQATSGLRADFGTIAQVPAYYWNLGTGGTAWFRA